MFLKRFSAVKINANRERKRIGAGSSPANESGSKWVVRCSFYFLIFVRAKTGQGPRSVGDAASKTMLFNCGVKQIMVL